MNPWLEATIIVLVSFSASFLLEITTEQRTTFLIAIIFIVFSKTGVRVLYKRRSRVK